MSRVVVTGGAGFLGSHLSKKLLDRGDTVVAVDNLVTGNLGSPNRVYMNDGGARLQTAGDAASKANADPLNLVRPLAKLGRSIDKNQL